MANFEPYWREVLDALNWQAAAFAALLATGMLLMVRRGRSLVVAALLRSAIVVIAVIATLALFSLASDLQNDAERRTLQARASEIAARALAPGSALACLNGEAGEAVENACEKAVFAHPENAAAAVAYTEARLVLLADALDLAGGDTAFDATLAGLRR